jgi:hypothetical protein
MSGHMRALGARLLAARLEVAVPVGEVTASTWRIRPARCYARSPTDLADGILAPRIGDVAALRRERRLDGVADSDGEVGERDNEVARVLKLVSLDRRPAACRCGASRVSSSDRALLLCSKPSAAPVKRMLFGSFAMNDDRQTA